MSLPHLRLPSRALPDRATVYTRTAATGRFETVEATDLRCYLSTVSAVNAPAVGGERAELSSLRYLYWDGAYQMPENARVSVNASADQWTVERNTAVPFPAGAESPLYWRAFLHK